jgi:hypothetical protein
VAVLALERPGTLASRAAIAWPFGGSPPPWRGGPLQNRFRWMNREDKDPQRRLALRSDRASLKAWEEGASARKVTARTPPSPGLWLERRLQWRAPKSSS